MPLPGALDLGRDHYDRREWAAAFAQLAAADRACALEPSDLVRLAKSAFLVGQDGDAVEVHALDCVEQGYLLLPAALEAAGAGDAAAAGAAFHQAASIGVRFGEADLI